MECAGRQSDGKDGWGGDRRWRAERCRPLGLLTGPIHLRGRLHMCGWGCGSSGRICGLISKPKTAVGQTKFRKGGDCGTHGLRGKWRINSVDEATDSGHFGGRSAERNLYADGDGRSSFPFEAMHRSWVDVCNLRTWFI